MRNKNLAIEYAKKALKANKKNALAYSTLAEAYGMMGNDLEFYRNTELALKYGFPIWDQLDDAPYIRYAQEDHFKSLLSKYQNNF